ncbi:MAG: rhomboid family intramembrane serine protease [Flammeovirgaceae bacterium]|nr:rhomboid family intramembrane serine protease [Flammeovirgaceae bacterium]MDW8287713.1 rhomboid family intramembrane serine protease [Flammeovirgaceae bacterium]
MNSYSPSLSESIRIPVTIVSLFWFILLLEKATDSTFSTWGIFPRSLRGLIGIFLSPFLHGSFSHLFSNSMSFLILGTSTILFYPQIAKKVYLYIYFFTGIGVWLFARPNYHIGASGIIYGLASFLFFSGIFRKDMQSWAIAISVALIFNGMIYGVFPQKQGISWESHLIGGLVGAACAYHLRTSGEEEEYKRSLDVPFEGYRNIENDYFRYVYKERGNRQKDT